MKANLIIAGLLSVLAVSTVRADDFFDILASRRRPVLFFRMGMGGYYLAEFTEYTETGKGFSSGKAKIIMQLGEPLKEGDPTVFEFPRLNIKSLPPLKKPVIIYVNVRNKKAHLYPFTNHPSPRNLFLKRGGLDNPYFQITCELLFPQREQLDMEKFHMRLLELCRHKDPRIVDLASSYMGSKINVYANMQCPEKVTIAFTDLLLDGTTEAALRNKVAAFYQYATLPNDPH